MLEFKFKIRETTRNGRLLKDLFKTDDDVCCRIPLSKVCGKCCDEVDDQSKIVNCFICKNNYHASCLTHTLSPDCLSALTANPHLWWFCAACTTTSEVAHGEQKSAPDQVAQPMPLLSSFFNSSSKVSTSPQVQQPVPPASAEILSVAPNGNDVSAAKMNDVKRFVTDTLKTVPVEFITANDKSKKISIGFRDSDTRQKADALVNANDTLRSYGYSSKMSNKMLPKVTISNVSIDILDGIDLEGANGDVDQIRDIKKHSVIMKIIEKNPSVKALHDEGHTLQVVYLNTNKRTTDKTTREELTIGLKVSPAIYQVLLHQQAGSIYIGNRRYKVTDRFFVKQCYHCQMIGHTSQSCQEALANRPPKCMYCAGSHRSAECTKKRNKTDHACARCLASTSTSDSQAAKTHNAGSNQCPIIVRETRRLAALTDFTSKNMRSGRAGGVGFIFDPSRINPIRNDVKSHSSFEAVECIINSVQKPIRLCTIYRSTQSKGKYEETKMTKFFEEFEEYLDSLILKTGIPVICGDFNIHIEDITNIHAKRFKSLYESKGFVQHVVGPTHNSGGTLDLVLSLQSVSDALIISEIVVDPNTGTASDHYLIKFEIPVAFKNRSARSYEEKEVREYKNICVDKFREDLFTNLISGKCQAAKRNRQRAKRRLKKAKQKLHDNPLADINIEEIRADHHEKSVDAAITINTARDNFYGKQLDSYKGDARGTYKVINKLLDKEYGSNKVPNGEDQDVANRLKDFFHNKVKNIYSGITAEIDSVQCIDKSPQLTPAAKSSFCEFREVSVSDLESIIKSMPDKSSSLDAIPFWLFKECLPEMLPITHYIVNQSLKEGVFPEDLKIASIRPKLKKPTLDVDDLCNYRPISNLTFLSKILEKVVHDQLNTYVTTNNLYAKFQSGYRKHHSCETAVTRIHNDILMLIDKKTNVLLLLLDLSAAFDTINHSLLLQKLKHSFGITNIVLKWLTSYLSNRKFKVFVKKGESEECNLEIGVPQENNKLGKQQIKFIS
ncbi:hypothetical protein ACHWQZ_G010747 [Mnemiopsis leidyi]